MVESGEGLFFLADIEGRTIFASTALYTFCGREEGTANGSAWRDLIHSDDRAYVVGLLDVMARDESFAAWFRLVRHDGAYPWVLCGGAPVVSEITGSVFAYMCTIYPLQQPDAFARAGGLSGPDRSGTETARVKVERVADMALMAAALAREGGETGIAEALEAALERIGFRLAQLSRHPDDTPPGAPRRPARQRRKVSPRG